MTRGPVFVRDAVADDAASLLDIWTDIAPDSERASRERSSVEEVQEALQRLEADPFERLIVAVVDGDAVGVAHLRRAAISPIHVEDAVHVTHLHVLSGFRRRGIAKQMLEYAADWADTHDTKHMIATVAANSRDANRFLARLGLGQVAVVRASTVAGLRSKLGAASGGKATASVTSVVHARRLMRRRGGQTV